MKKARAKAVLLSPRIVEQAAGAVSALDRRKPKDALPPEEEALRMLREIAQELPKNDEGQKPPEPPQKKDGDSPDPSQAKAPSRPGQMSREQTEQLLRKAREREREHNERRRELEGMLRGSSKVDRDW